jgi:DNA-binding CsgD family transcriptional regulator
VRFAGAFCTWREGRGEQALPGLRDIVTRTLDAGAPALAAPWVVEWAELAAGLGQPDPGAVAAMEGVAARTGSPVHRALADLARAWTRRGAGDRPGTRAAAARTAREMDRCGWPIYVARARFLQGWGEPDRERAVTLLRAAAETFDACGALVRRDAALEALGRRGSRGRRAAAAAAGPGSLTPREREVAGLAAAGLPAREIGAALFIGERTVEGHLARVYARLGVRSKVELARRAAEFGLDGAGSRTGARTFPPDPDPGEP